MWRGATTYLNPLLPQPSYSPRRSARLSVVMYRRSTYRHCLRVAGVRDFHDGGVAVEGDDRIVAVNP